MLVHQHPRRALQSKGTDYLDRLRIHKELPSEHTASTSRGEKCSAYKPQIGIGMTREQAKAAWCEPFEINTTETASSIREQWGLPAEPRLPLF